MSLSCADVARLGADFKAGRLPPEDAAHVAAHLDTCEPCQAAVEAFPALFRDLPVRQVDLVAGVRAGIAQRPPVPPPPYVGAARYLAPLVGLAVLFFVIRPGSAPLADGRSGTWEAAGAKLALGSELVAAGPLRLTDPTGNLTLALVEGTRVRRTERGLDLAEGTVGLAIARGSSPGFVVQAGDVAVRVSGTRFTVKRAEGGVRVELLDGTTFVTGKRGTERRMVPGEVLQIDAAGVVRVSWLSKEELARVAGWVHLPGEPPRR